MSTARIDDQLSVTKELSENVESQNTAPDLMLQQWADMAVRLMDNLCQINEGKKSFITLFESESIPTFSIRDYLNRFVKYADIEACNIQQMLYFIDMFVQKINEVREDKLLVRYTNVHRLIMTALMCSAKVTCDKPFNNAFFAKLGGVPVSELNKLELEFLFGVKFCIFLDNDAEKFQQYCEKMRDKFVDLCVKTPTQSFADSTTSVIVSSAKEEKITSVSQVVTSSQQEQKMVFTNSSTKSSSLRASAPTFYARANQLPSTTPSSQLVSQMTQLRQATQTSRGSQSDPIGLRRK